MICPSNMDLTGIHGLRSTSYALSVDSGAPDLRLKIIRGKWELCSPGGGDFEVLSLLASPGVGTSVFSFSEPVAESPLGAARRLVVPDVARGEEGPLVLSAVLQLSLESSFPWEPFPCLRRKAPRSS